MIERIDRSQTWHAPSQTLIQCPVPDCTHTSNAVITKAHCRVAHDMEREEVNKLYGKPIILKKRGKSG